MLHLNLAMPTINHQTEYCAMVAESIILGEGYPYNNIELATQDFPAFIQELADETKGIGLPPDIAPQQTYLLMKDSTTVVGEFRFRPTLEAPYEAQNGHIGYNIRPSERGKGYATQGLALVLAQAQKLGLGGVLLTIEGDNPASVRVIEKNGGKYLRQFVDTAGEQVACYWIDL